MRSTDPPNTSTSRPTKRRGSGLVQAFDPRALGGLSEAEANARIKEEGPNELPSDAPPSLVASIAAVLREPMLLLLLVAGGLYLVLGDVREALTLLSFVAVIITITLVQERKTERALAALRDLSSPRALVIRDGKERRIPGRDVARGDIVVLAEGDRVPADIVALNAVGLEADESLLTGESVPVRKIAAASSAAPLDKPGGDDTASVFSGTLVVKGRGVGVVKATGARTEIGAIGKALQEVETERTGLEREVGRLVRVVAVVGAALCVVLFVGYGVVRGDWLHGLLAGITLAMAVLPEEFPVVLTVFLALGAWRISKSRVLTRRAAAVEALGAATVLCSDKTGTLTANKMRVDALWAEGNEHNAGDDRDGGELSRDPQGGPWELPERVHELVEVGILASQTDPFDPMDIALKGLGEEALAGTEHIHADWTLVREYPLAPPILAVSHVWSAPGGERYVIAAKGAPEAIADLCHLDARRTEVMLGRARTMAARGLRVLAAARAYMDKMPLPEGQHDFAFEPVGLIGLADPVRAAVPAAVRECHEAGIRVIMITGDYPETARSVAKTVGLDPDAGVITGPELDAMDEAELRQRAKTASIFARVVPSQKLRIVGALKANGEVVAMTGDGVNDAPALKAAHIGVAMGGRGTDVAREASALVLTDDDFSSIVAAVRLGRRIFENLRKSMAYILAVHVPVAGMSLIPVLAGWPLMLFPVHIVFVELIIDPACSIVFEAEPEEPGVMRRPPRPTSERLIGWPVVVAALAQGAGALAATVAVYARALERGDEARARAAGFATILFGNLLLILVNRSWSRSIFTTLATKNRAAWLVLAGALGTLAAVLYVPWLRGLFRFAPLTPRELLTALGAAAAGVLWFELWKALRRNP